jgi:hypothetical protein
MKKELIQQTEELIASLKVIEETNPAAWKARRKLDAALEILNSEWPAEVAAPLAREKKSAKPLAPESPK